jgi:transcriptional regulator
MVQVRGKPRVVDDLTWLQSQITVLTNNQESDRQIPWKITDAPDDFIAAQLKGIVGVEIPIRSIEGKWKLSQNRSQGDRQGVIDGLRAESACPAILDLMD